MKKSLVKHLTYSLSSFGVGEKDNLFIGVSGGIDSMVLMHLVNQAGYILTATHINYHLRGEDSNKDAALVKEFCEQLNVPLLIYDVHQEDVVFTKEDNVQLRAREIRYNWWDSLLSNSSGSWMLTAHHLNDAMESSIFNLIRGTGIKGIGGIRSKNKHYIRPLLEITQEELHQYQQEYEIPFRIDSSNETDAYSRNKIRHHVTPSILYQFPNALSGFKASHNRIEAELELWDTLFQNWVTENVKHLPNGAARITVIDAYVVFAARYLEEGGIPYSLALEFIRSNLPTRNGILEYRNLKLIRSQEGFDLITGDETNKDVILSQTGIYNTDEAILSISPIKRSEVVIDNGEICCFPLQLITWPLYYRKPRGGDKMQPFGMGGKSKKLQDIFTDSKWSQAQKFECGIIADERNVLWIPGLVKSELSRLDNQYEDWIRIQFI